VVRHVTLVTHKLLVWCLPAPAQVTGTNAAQLVWVVLAVLAGRAALPCAQEGRVSPTGQGSVPSPMRTAQRSRLRTHVAWGFPPQGSLRLGARS
jgi:hypothetical protein